MIVAVIRDKHWSRNEDFFRSDNTAVINAVSLAEMIAEMTRGYTPANTHKLGFKCIQRVESSSCPSNLLENLVVEELNKWIPRFVNEVM